MCQAVLRMSRAVTDSWISLWFPSSLDWCCSSRRVTMPGRWQKTYQWSFIIPTQENCRCFQDHIYFWTAADICVGFGNSLGQNRENCHIGDSVEVGKYMTLICLSLFFFSFFCVQVKILVDFPRKLMMQKCTHCISWGIVCSWHPLGVEKHVSY